MIVYILHFGTCTLEEMALCAHFLFYLIIYIYYYIYYYFAGFFCVKFEGFLDAISVLFADSWPQFPF